MKSTLRLEDQSYRAMVILLLNAVLVCAVANGGIALYEDITGPEFEPLPELGDSPLPVYGFGPITKHGFDPFQEAYYYLEDHEILRLMLESWNVLRLCSDDGLFREEPTRGNYVNVDPAGFRWSDPQAAWPPDDENFNIFIFGNSAVFGYGQPDNLTIASYVQYYLRQDLGTERIAVYNFGRAVYYSELERRLLETLVNDGHIPDAAIFIDGLTEFTLWHGRTDQFRCRTEPSFSERLGETLRCQSDEVCLPAQNLAEDWAGFLESDMRAEAAIAPLPDEPPPDDEATNRAAIDRWLANKASIASLAEAHNIATLFVIQPVPVYRYDLQYHLFADSLDDLSGIARVHYGYALWESLYNDPDADWTDDVVNLMAAGEDNLGPVYVDETHYAFGFSDEIGRAIADAMLAFTPAE